MKRILTTAFIIALSFGAAQAQKQEGAVKKEHGQHKDGPGKGHEGRGLEQLNLSADQKTRIKSINESYHKQMTDLKSQSNITVADAKARREALQKQHVADIQAVLTAEQRAKFESQKKDWDAKGKKGDFKKGEGFRNDSTGVGKRGEHQGMRDEKGFAKMQQELNLSTDQQAKMAQLREEFKTKSENIRSNSSLSQDQKKEQFKSLAQEQKQKMKSILTKEQIEKLESARGKRANKNTK